MKVIVYISFKPSLEVFSIDEIPFPVSPISPFSPCEQESPLSPLGPVGPVGPETSIIESEFELPHEVTVPSKTAGNIETAKTFKNLFFILKRPLFYKVAKQ